ncbi:acetyl-CoA-benzylalcohol acetyltransferase-like [Eucalyptus grandis]|uniref:acetyl-CoA-benzylalcohol acetyltransferase-like n=1 Tax=Eucalyptus grandis TaxID=71139 RepID=UPI00192E8BD7|nr:acetyl-CoA-benzylalcohol acetyltransferase-like [Eucalyptus grandis]
MYTMAMFMNSWATACRSGIQEVVPPNFELPSLFPVKEPALIQWPTLPFRKKFALARLKFSGQALSRMKAASDASDSSDSIANNSQRSRVEIVSALICKALITVDRVTKGLLRPFVCSTAINLRERVQLKTPMNACGNFFAQITTPLAVEETEPSFNGILNQLGNAHRNAKLKYADSRRCWCRFPLYDSDFGWGKPDMVSNSSPPLRSVGLVDSPVDGGIDAWITLNQDEMALFKQDPDIVDCTS